MILSSCRNEPSGIVDYAGRTQSAVSVAEAADLLEERIR